MGVQGQHLSSDKKAEILRRLRAGEVPAHVATAVGISQRTVYSYAKEVRTEQPAPAFTAPDLPSSSIPIEELIDRRRAESQRVIAADAARELIPIKIHTPGPVGLLVMGDPHVDNSGCDFAALERHLHLAAARPQYLFAANVGDVTDNWIGRLERIYASATTTKADAWRLAEWMMRDVGVKWLFLVKGNHDVWSGSSDPLDWIMRGSGGITEPHSVRLNLQHPNGAGTRVHVRHNFKGNSQYNGLHGMARELAFGFRDHILACGHLHYGEDAGQINADGFVTQMVRVAGYKAVDDYAKAGGFKSKRIHPSALIVIDPDKPDNDRSRVWCAPTVEEGIEYLDWKRARFEGNVRVRVSAR